MKKEALKAKAIETLNNDDELFVKMIEELDSWNGYADGFRCWDMGLLDAFYCDTPASKLIRDMVEDFSVNDDFFYFSIYGLESTSDRVDLYRYNVSTGELLDNILDNAPHLDIARYDSDFADLIEEIENADE